MIVLQYVAAVCFGLLLLFSYCWFMHMLFKLRHRKSLNQLKRWQGVSGLSVQLTGFSPGRSTIFSLIDYAFAKDAYEMRKRSTMKDGQ